MQRAASVFVTLFLLGLCALLAGPAFNLHAFDRTGNIAAGALPQAVVIVVAGLAMFALLSDALDHFRGKAPREDEDWRTVLLIGGAMLLLLAGLLFLWPRLGFPLATTVFMAAASALVAPRESRTPRGYAVILVFSAVFSIGVWLAFTNILGVPLR